RRYCVTSVPQTPATSTLINAASSGIGGRSSSRSSVVEGPTFTAARALLGIHVTDCKACRLASQRTAPAQRAENRITWPDATSPTDARLLELRPHRRAGRRPRPGGRHRPERREPAGGGNVLSHGAAPRVRCRRDVAVVVCGVAVPARAVTGCHPDLPVT